MAPIGAEESGAEAKGGGRGGGDDRLLPVLGDAEKPLGLPIQCLHRARRRRLFGYQCLAGNAVGREVRLLIVIERIGARRRIPKPVPDHAGASAIGRGAFLQRPYRQAQCIAVECPIGRCPGIDGPGVLARRGAERPIHRRDHLLDAAGTLDQAPQPPPFLGQVRHQIGEFVLMDVSRCLGQGAE